jgi:hypothetical protein
MNVEAKKSIHLWGNVVTHAEPVKNVISDLECALQYSNTPQLLTIRNVYLISGCFQACPNKFSLRHSCLGTEERST